MNLTIDIGNTLIKSTVFSGGSILREDTIDKDVIFNLEQILQNFPDIDKIIVSSVRKDDNIIVSFLEQLNTKKFIYLDEHTPLPIKNAYESTATLGKDRIALAVGGNAMFPNENVLIIDCGTAVTFEVVNASNIYEGGNISPGVEMRLKALHHFTQGLPLVDKEGLVQVIGKNTQDAIRNGVINGIAYEIEGYISSLQKGYPGLNVILAGGDAKLFDKKLKNTIFVVLNLIPKGLNRILEYND